MRRREATRTLRDSIRYLDSFNLEKYLTVNQICIGSIYGINDTILPMCICYISI
uniref:Uncharacterized protein n=1 Tax=Lepeophtheirus salmonis TaxID=72036 RepID=A0A0K2VKU2_LEPSM